jgi:hypothetical protein
VQSLQPAIDLNQGLTNDRADIEIIHLVGLGPGEKVPDEVRQVVSQSRADKTWIGAGPLADPTKVRSTGEIPAAADCRRKHEGHRLRLHRGATVSVESKLADENFVFCASFEDELLGQFLALAICDHPRDDLTAEHIEDDAERLGCRLV